QIPLPVFFIYSTRFLSDFFQGLWFFCCYYSFQFLPCFFICIKCYFSHPDILLETYSTVFFLFSPYFNFINSSFCFTTLKKQLIILCPNIIFKIFSSNIRNFNPIKR